MEVEAPVMDAERSGTAVTSQTVTARPETPLMQEGMTPTEPPFAQASVSVMGQMEAGASEASMENMVIGTTPMPPTPAATERIVLEEALLQEGSASLGVGVGPSQALAQAVGDLHMQGGPLLWCVARRDLTSTLFTLDDDAEEMERESIDVGVASAFEALNNTMGVLRDVFTPAS
jgi:hypothetical protein